MTCICYRIKENMTNSQKPYLTRGVLANQTGINPETIRYYEKINLMPVPSRSAGGHRIYEDQHSQRLRFIKRCRELGFTLDEIRGLLTLVDRQEVSCERVQHLADDHVISIRRKIADLRSMERTPRDLSSQCSGKDVPECPIMEALQK
jgi:MerR family transcriptional regulator, mercuric resistance operon regulatory protein